MGQGYFGGAFFNATLSFYISPAGHWKVDLLTSDEHDRQVKTPLLSGHSSRWLSKSEVDTLRDVVFGMVDRGIHVIADPT